MNTYDMYKGTTVEALADNFVDVIKRNCVDISEAYKEIVYNIETASSGALDLWGKMLGFPRYVYDGSASGFKLEDDEYRVVLKTVYASLTLEPTIKNLNRMMLQLFSKLGLAAYIEDPQDMSVQYIFTSEMPKWLRIVFYTYGIIPHPMGVGTTAREKEVGIFGFEGQQVNKRIGNWTNSIFYPASGIETAPPVETAQAPMITKIKNKGKK